MTEWFSAEQVATTLGASLGNVETNYPQIVTAMAQEGLGQRPDMICALATIGTEVSGFCPIPEWGSGMEYEGRCADLGNCTPGDGPRYKGRGFIQLTGRANYEHYGRQLGVDLVGNPDLALDVHIAALVLARYFVERGTADRARAGQWSQARITVNGGLNGWSRFWSLVQGLNELPAPAEHPVTSIPPLPILKVIHDTQLRSEPVLESIVRPVVLLKTGSLVQNLGPWTASWKMIRTAQGQVGWLYANNLAKA